MDANKIGGKLTVKVGGVQQWARGEWSYNLGRPKREAVVGVDGTHGYQETPQVAFIEGTISNRGDLDVGALCEITNETVTIELDNGKTVFLRNGWYAADGTVKANSGEVEVRFEGRSGDEVTT